MKHTFEYVERQTIKTIAEFKDGFEFRADRKYQWIQKICFYILKKIGAYRTDYIYSYKKITIKPDSFMEQLFKQNAYLQKEFDIKPSQLFIGSEDYHKLMGDKEIMQMLQFNTSYNYQNYIMGLKVTIIPWMRGIIIMP